MDCGVYIIICISNNRFYIGSSIDIKRRWNQHRAALKANRHDNRHLQNAWNKYGESAFEFNVLQYVNKIRLEESEQRYIELLQPFDPKGFNIQKIVDGVLKGVPVSDETRKKMSIAFKKRPPFSEDHRRNLSNSLKGKQLTFTKEHCNNISKGSTGLPKSPEHIENMAETKRKEYVVTSPEGVEIAIKGMRKFCASNDINNAAMIRVAQGKQKAHKGWVCRYV